MQVCMPEIFASPRKTLSIVKSSWYDLTSLLPHWYGTPSFLAYKKWPPYIHSSFHSFRSPYPFSTQGDVLQRWVRRYNNANGFPLSSYEADLQVLHGVLISCHFFTVLQPQRYSLLLQPGESILILQGSTKCLSQGNFIWFHYAGSFRNFSLWYLIQY